MEIRQAIRNLSEFVRAMVAKGVKSKKDFNAWKKQPESIKLMEKLFAYNQKKGMPCINALVTVDFHPEIPVLLLNYTQVAHNTLHEFPDGWTRPLRQCRGIVFDFDGNLVAKPFEKFFNYGEHPETMSFPQKLSWESPEKKDGHLGIIFEYKGKIYITTRGSFTSPTMKVAQSMLDEYISQGNWAGNYIKDETVLVEIIHPQTKVLTDYQDFKAFILIGCMNRVNFADYDYLNLTIISRRLSLPLVRIWQGNSLEDLQKLIKDRSVKNKEGFVVHFHNGLRIKLKFESYIGLMVASKLSYKYLMQRAISGSLEKMISTLPEEIYQIAMQMLGQIYLVMLCPLTPKEKWSRLYQLVPEEEQTDHFKGICREFVKSQIP